jgi:hypothetical protein
MPSGVVRPASVPTTGGVDSLGTPVHVDGTSSYFV